MIGTHNVIRGCEEHKVKLARLCFHAQPLFWIFIACECQRNRRLPEPRQQLRGDEILAEEEIDKAFANGHRDDFASSAGAFWTWRHGPLSALDPRLRSGRLPILGDGENIIDLTYIENVVDALFLCAESPANTLGKKYNISNGEPVNIWKLVERICTALDLQPPKRKISYRTAYAARECA